MPAAPPATPPSLTRPAGRFANGRELFDFYDALSHALGGIPPERIVFDPWPGLAREADLVTHIARTPCEKIDDTLVEKAMGFWEARIAVRLAARIDAFADAHELGIVNGPHAPMRVAGGNVRMPDVTFVSHARAPKTDEPVPTLSPDLIVEILSDGNTPAEIDRKVGEFFVGGTRLAWVIDRRTRTVAVRRPDAGTLVLDAHASLTGGDVLPCFAMPVPDLFAGLPDAPDAGVA